MQGRPLCDACQDRRRASKNARKQRVRRQGAAEDCRAAAKLLRHQQRAIVAAMHRLDPEAEEDEGAECIHWVIDALDDIVKRGPAGR